MNLLIWIVTCILFILVLQYQWQNNHIQYLQGIWAGDDSFLQQAGLSDMLIVFDKCCKRMRIVCTDVNNNVLINVKTAISISPYVSFVPYVSFISNKYRHTIQLRVQRRPNCLWPESWPDAMDMVMSMRHGTLVLKHKKTVYAMCIKDNASTLLI